MELNIREILLSHHQYIAGISQIDITAIFVYRHILRLPLLEIVQHGSIVALYPASFI